MTIYAVRASRVIQYDGGNAAELLEALNAQNQLVAVLVSETPNKLILRLESYGGPSQGGGLDVVQVEPTDWVRPTGDWAEVIPAAVFDSQWIQVQA